MCSTLCVILVTLAIAFWLFGDSDKNKDDKTKLPEKQKDVIEGEIVMSAQSPRCPQCNSPIEARCVLHKLIASKAFPTIAHVPILDSNGQTIAVSQEQKVITRNTYQNLFFCSHCGYEWQTTSAINHEGVSAYSEPPQLS